MRVAVGNSHRRSSATALHGGFGALAIVASLLFGALWTLWGIHTAIVFFGVALLAAIALAAVLFVRSHEYQHA